MSKMLPPVDDDVFAALQALAEPLVDDVNTVLRRVLGLDGETAQFVPAAPMAARETEVVQRVEQPTPAARRDGRRRAARPQKTKSSSKKPRAPRGSLLPEREYELPMLRYLAGVGGRAPASEVIEAIGAELGDRLTATDREILGSGIVRWKNRTQFVRLKLIQEGAMVKESPRGVWEITDLGRARLNGSSA